MITPEQDQIAARRKAAAARALAEAAERRKAEEAARAQAPSAPTELGGRKGPEPTRYGDWENKGIAVDF